MFTRFKSIVLQSPLRNIAINGWIRLNYNSLAPKALEVIEKYNYKPASEREKRCLILDMLRVHIQYHLDYDEYFIYHVPLRSEKGRQSLVADADHLKIAEAMNVPENQILFDDKMRTYDLFSKYYRRTLMKFDDDSDESVSSFETFVKKNPIFVVKPLDSSGGRGVQWIDLSEQINLKNRYLQLLNDYNGQFIVEELVIQSNLLASLHPHSVNTVRMYTIRYDDRIDVIHPFLRIGQGGNFVDNAFSGGIFGSIDVDTGIITATADEQGNRYVTHPDTGEPIIGFRIPFWDEVIEFAKELAQVIPDNRYSGWDLALTDEGWIMIEGNARSQFVWQMPTQEGFMDELRTIFSELGIKMKGIN